MNLTRALDILNSLSEGVDPATGEVFPPDHVLQRPDVIRALGVAAKEVERATWRERRKQTGAENAGKPWWPDEDDRLTQGFGSGFRVEDLARQHGRTVVAIRERLVKLGRLTPSH